MDRPTPPPMRVIRSGGWLTKTPSTPIMWDKGNKPKTWLERLLAS